MLNHHISVSVGQFDEPPCVYVRVQAIYASVLPGELMRGYMSHFPSFPSWLGKNSSTGKHSRVVQELTSHMGLR